MSKVETIKVSEQVDLEKETGNKIASIVRIVLFLGILIAIIVVIALATPSTKPANEIWDERTTIGNLQAKKHYVQYTDLMCPYCDVFSRGIMNNQEDFEQWLKDNDVVYELRVSDFLYEYNSDTITHSRQSAIATICAKNENKFWEYYHNAVKSLWDDYHSKGIGDSKSSPMITDMTDKYWLEVGHEIGLGESFDNCYNNKESLDEVKDNAAKTAKQMSKSGQGGMPFFQFEDFVTSGFDNTWGYDYVKKYLNAGLSKQK